jgi:hypothetical protein
VLLANCARGLRKSDWRELVDHLLTAVGLVAGVSECDALTLSLKQLE